jgi:Anti-sigma factor NepR
MTPASRRSLPGSGDDPCTRRTRFAAGTILAAACLANVGRTRAGRCRCAADPAGNRADRKSDRVEVGMPVLKDWGRQMRQRVSVADRSRSGPRHCAASPPVPHRTMPQPERSAIPAHLGKLLREMYDFTLSEPVPERFLKMLRQRDPTPDPAAEGSARSLAGPAEPNN